MKIIGLRIEKYIDKRIEGHNCDFKYYDDIFTRHVICGVNDDNIKVEITLSQSEGECGSGYSTESFGHMSLEKVDKFKGYSYVPIENLVVDDIPLNFKDIADKLCNHVFSFSSYGFDSYYPNGGYSVNMDLFKETKRIHKNRPVWILRGDSNSGKSFLSSKLKDLTIYETDISENLLEVIKQDVIVLGNKYPQHTVEEVQKRIFGDHDLIIVEFKNKI